MWPARECGCAAKIRGRSRTCIPFEEAARQQGSHRCRRPGRFTRGDASGSRAPRRGSGSKAHAETDEADMVRMLFLITSQHSAERLRTCGTVQARHVVESARFRAASDSLRTLVLLPVQREGASANAGVSLQVPW